MSLLSVIWPALVDEYHEKIKGNDACPNDKDPNMLLRNHFGKNKVVNL